jgi:Na+/melibiose symporter-like transporter
MMSLLFLTQFFHAAIGSIMSAMIAETIEYSEVVTRMRCEAITFSGQTFMGKLCAAVADSLTGIILVMIGYVPEAAVQSQATLDGLFFVISLLPIPGGLIRLGILSTYKCNEEAYRNDLAILAKRKAEAAA